MKTKRLLTLLFTVLLLTVFAAAAPAGAEEKQRVTSPEEASAFVRALFGEDPASLDGAFVLTPVLEQTLAVYGGWQGIALQLTALGPLVRTDAAYEGTLQGYRIFYVPCVFTAMPLDIWIVMDGDAVAQVLTGDYTGGPAETAAFEEIDLPLPVPALNGALPGTLTLPAGEGPFPAVILVHGSGPSDRDESIGALKPFRDLAQGLAERGIAVYRYDKRTWVYPVQCAADHGVTLMDETADDAAAAVRLLAEQEAVDPERVFVLGHSLGATAVPAVPGGF
ncbi:MAG: hypothetical protein CW338_11660 [Clostridiales bacterium]|nr:hypothetical protein [Clostridiales bacterium]